MHSLMIISTCPDFFKSIRRFPSSVSSSSKTLLTMVGLINDLGETVSIALRIFVSVLSINLTQRLRLGLLLWHDLRSSAIRPELDRVFHRCASICVVSSYHLLKFKKRNAHFSVSISRSFFRSNILAHSMESSLSLSSLRGSGTLGSSPDIIFLARDL